MEFHEAANIFPLDEGKIDSLADDIKKQNGLLVPIETLGGKIIDGRRRWIACGKAGIEPTFREVSCDDPVSYVLSLNLHRRHLTPSQLSMVGARARKFYDDEAKKRQKASGGDRKSANERSVVENLPQPISDAGKARDQVGKAVGVSGKSIDYATRVLAQGIPELATAVDEGRMAISTAAILATESPDKQMEEIKKPKRNRKYEAGPNGSKPRKKPKAPKEKKDGEILGVGIIRGHEAIDCLKRIPKNDGLRKRGFQVVKDWIRSNQ